MHKQRKDPCNFKHSHRRLISASISICELYVRFESRLKPKLSHDARSAFHPINNICSMHVFLLEVVFVVVVVVLFFVQKLFALLPFPFDLSVFDALANTSRSSCFSSGGTKPRSSSFLSSTDSTFKALPCAACLLLKLSLKLLGGSGLKLRELLREEDEFTCGSFELVEALTP